MKNKTPVESLILDIRGSRVIFAADLADIYKVQTKVLNQAVKRHAERFPADFCFQLEHDEFADLMDRGLVARDGRAVLRSQFVTLNKRSAKSKNTTSKPGRHTKYPPYVFTEHGAVMAANVLNSRNAVTMSVYVVRAFIQMRERIIANATILKRLAEIDKTLLEHDQSLRIIWQKLQPILQPPPEPLRRRIGFQTEK